MQFAALPIVLHVPPYPIVAHFITTVVFGEE
jgi:hypothetical protein